MKELTRALILLCVDILIAIASVFSAILIFAEFDFGVVSSDYLPVFIRSLPFLVISSVAASAVFRIPTILWQFISSRDMVWVSCATVLNFVLYLVMSRFANLRLSKSVYVIACLFALVLTFGLRMMMRILLNRIRFKEKAHQGFKGKITGNIMIIGAGNAASLLIHDIRRNYDSLKSKIRCVIDDDPQKIGQTFCGVTIVGGRESIAANAQKYKIDTIIFAIPSISGIERSKILDLCTRTDCSVKILPSFTTYINNSVNLSSVRDVNLEDLLGRDPINPDIEKVIGYVENKTILVTGGGGSIGSELCRQLAAHNPKKLIIFDVYENNAYDILNELKRQNPSLDVIALIGSVRDTRRMECVFSKYRPDIVYHAAAHKHVPLMEDSPNESIKNNVFGTLKTVRAADKYKVKRFVLISTDKAVNPTNIMGASKRICEMIIQTFNKHSETEFVAVRFGNVLGSNGSVIPLFKQEIAEGGPVTVTHKDIVRFFMTIPEAVSLVLQAGGLAKGGEIFVLDMGQPVKILTLAEDFIRLSGLKPYEDIKIEFTGLRPGEKLYEEILMDEEGLSQTENKLIFIGKPLNIDEELFLKNLKKLEDSMYDDSADIRQLVHEIVPTYVLPKHETVEE